MLPSFDLAGGGPLALVRAAAVAALLSVFGAQLFRVVVAPRSYSVMPADAAVPIARRIGAVTRISIIAACVALLLWLTLQSAAMADAATPAAAFGALPKVLEDTAFGHIILLQLAALAATWAALRGGERRPMALLSLAGSTLALGLQAGHSHAASMYGGPSVLLGFTLLHLLAAGGWLGGLLPLLLVVRDAPARGGMAAARWFSPLGKICIVALTASCAFQGWVLVASIPGLVGTAYGWMVLAKLALFGVLFVFAVVNRYRLAPALRRHPPDPARRALVRSIAFQTAFGLVIVAAAGLLSGLEPAMHVQPIWPFADQFTLDTISEDPAFRNEVLAACSALVVAVALLAVAVMLRRWRRWIAAGSAVAIAWFAIPHLDLLFVPAYPTSFYHSPTGFAASSIVAGAALFPQHCASCHGTEGRGDGAAAANLPVPPADLTAGHLWMHSDGELFWWLSHGIEAPEGGIAMPGFAGTLSEDDRWALIDYIRAKNAGLAHSTNGAWDPPVQAPGFQADCADGRTFTLNDLRGQFVRVVFGAAAATTEPGVTTIVVASHAATRPAPGTCIADDETIAPAYAIVTGLKLADMHGSQILIDEHGWLRAVQTAGAAPGWNDHGVLDAEVRTLRAHPVGAVQPGASMQMPM